MTTEICNGEVVPERTTFLPTGNLQPNNYNPNVMTEEEFAELVQEVRHLGGLPKPVIVRPCGEVFTIVDGEHSWRAAKEIGLAEVPCEITTVNDFEAELPAPEFWKQAVSQELNKECDSQPTSGHPETV